MENNHEIKKNKSTQVEPDVVPQGETAASRPREDCARDGTSGTDCPQRATRATRARTDNARLHTRHHGVLSRYPLQALRDRGENLRELRKIEKMLRTELQPKMMLGEILFDRAWSSYLRCLLIGRTEASLFMVVDEQDSDRMPQLKEGDMPTLVWPEANAARFDFSADLTKHLETVLRYDTHFAREFYRAVGLLLAMQTGGAMGILDCL